MKKAYSIILFTVIICFSIWVVYKNSHESFLLRSDGVLTKGIVIDYKHSKKSSYTLYYSYLVGETKYYDEVPTNFFRCNDSEKPGCVGQEFQVIYSKANPSISDIDLRNHNKSKGMHIYF